MKNQKSINNEFINQKSMDINKNITYKFIPCHKPFEVLAINLEEACAQVCQDIDNGYTDMPDWDIEGNISIGSAYLGKVVPLV